MTRLTTKTIIQYCLVSEQPSPNLSPIYDSRVKPDEVVLVVSPEQRASGRAQNLESIILAKGIAVFLLEITDAWDKNKTAEQIDEDIEDRLSDSKLILLNATGGTKPMSIGAFEVFYNRGLPVFYINNDRLLWMYKPKSVNFKDINFQDIDLEDKLKLKTFLKAHGVNIIATSNNSVKPELQTLSKNWIDGINIYNSALAQLNYIAMNLTKKNQLKYVLKSEDLANKELQILLDDLNTVGILNKTGVNIEFNHPSGLTFANGGWLEGWVLKELTRSKKENPRIQDIKIGVEIEYIEQKGKKAVKNELDVVILANNQLYVIECKTSKLNKENYSKKGTKASDAIYKLSTIMREIGGIRAKGFVTSYHKVNDFDKERASLLNIEILDSVGLKNINKIILETINRQN